MLKVLTLIHALISVYGKVYLYGGVFKKEHHGGIEKRRYEVVRSRKERCI